MRRFFVVVACLVMAACGGGGGGGDTSGGGGGTPSVKPIVKSTSGTYTMDDYFAKITKGGVVTEVTKATLPIEATIVFNGATYQRTSTSVNGTDTATGTFLMQPTADLTGVITFIRADGYTETADYAITGDYTITVHVKDVILPDGSVLEEWDYMRKVAD